MSTSAEAHRGSQQCHAGAQVDDDSYVHVDALMSLMAMMPPQRLFLGSIDAEGGGPHRAPDSPWCARMCPPCACMCVHATARPTAPGARACARHVPACACRLLEACTARAAAPGVRACARMCMHAPCTHPHWLRTLLEACTAPAGQPLMRCTAGMRLSNVQQEVQRHNQWDADRVFSYLQAAGHSSRSLAVLIEDY
jgi:hypothetical protein